MMALGQGKQGKRGKDKKARKRRTNAEIERDRAATVANKKPRKVSLQTTIDLTSSPPPSPQNAIIIPDSPEAVAPIDLVSPDKKKIERGGADATAEKLVPGTGARARVVAPIFARAVALTGVPVRRAPRPPRAPLSQDQITLNKSRAGIASGAARKAAGIAKRKKMVRDLMVGRPCYCNLKTVRREKYDDKTPYWGCVKGRRADGGCGFYTERSDQQSPAPQGVRGTDHL